MEIGNKLSHQNPSGFHQTFVKAFLQELKSDVTVRLGGRQNEVEAQTRKVETARWGDQATDCLEKNIKTFIN